MRAANTLSPAIAAEATPEVTARPILSEEPSGFSHRPSAQKWVPHPFRVFLRKGWESTNPERTTLLPIRSGSKSIKVKFPFFHDNQDTMTLDWTTGALAEGLRRYRNEEFFLAHEHWEEIWLKCEEPDKTFLQALIQTTAAFHHLQQKNHAGAMSLLRAALRRLDPFPSVYSGIEVDPLRQSIRIWLDTLNLQEPSPQMPFPKIR